MTKNIIIAVLLVAIIIGGGFYLWNQNQESDTFYQQLLNLQAKKGVTVPSSFQKIATYDKSPCPPNPQELCGHKVFIMAKPDWKTTPAPQTFYLFEDSATGPLAIGSLKADLTKLLQAAENFTPLQ